VMIIESITLKRERVRTPTVRRRGCSRLRSKFADGTAKACEIQRYSRQKTARQRIKNSKHSGMRRTASEIPPMLVGDTPSPEVCGADKEKSANAD